MWIHPGNGWMFRMSPYGGWRSFISPAPSWEVKVSTRSPPLSHCKILGISDSHRSLPLPPTPSSDSGTHPCWRCHQATTSPHGHVPRGGVGTGVRWGTRCPWAQEHLRQPPAARGGRGCTAGIFLAFSLTESFQISLPLTSKRNESAAKRAWDFFSPLFPFRA